MLGGSHFAASSRSGSVGWRSRSRATSYEPVGQPLERAGGLEGADRLELLLRSAAGAHEIRVVGVRQPVRLAARGRDDRRSSKASTVSPAPAALSTASIASKPLA